MSIQTRTKKYTKKSKKAVKTTNDYTDLKKAIEEDDDYKKFSIRTTRSMSKERINDTVEKEVPPSSRRSKRSVIPAVVPQVDELTLNFLLKDNEKVRGRKSRKKILDQLDNEVIQDKPKVIEKVQEEKPSKLSSIPITLKSRLSNGNLGVTLRSKGNTTLESEDKPIKKSTKKASKLLIGDQEKKVVDETSDEDDDYLKLSKKKILATETSKIKSYISSKDVSQFSNVSKQALNILFKSANILILVFLLFSIFSFLFLSNMDPKSLTSLKSLETKVQKLWMYPRIKYPSSDSILIGGIFLLLQFALDKLNNKFKGFLSSVLTALIYACLAWYKPFINAIVLNNVSSFFYLFSLYTLLVVVIDWLVKMKRNVTLKRDPKPQLSKNKLLCYSDDEGGYEVADQQSKQPSHILYHVLTPSRASFMVSCGHSAWITILIANLAQFSLKPPLPFEYTISCYMQITFILMTQLMSGWTECDLLVTASPSKTSPAWVVFEGAVWAPFAFTAYLSVPRNSQEFSQYSYCVSTPYVICLLLGIVLRSNKLKIKKDLCQTGAIVLNLLTLSTCLLPGLQSISVSTVAAYLGVLFLRIYFFQ